MRLGRRATDQSNALGELGYALLDAEAEDLLTDLAPELLEAGLVDLGRDVKHVFDSTRPLDHQRCVGIIRKLFGSVVLFTVVGQGERLGEFCMTMRQEIVDKLHDQIGRRGRDQEEIFPLMMTDLALSLGFYVAEAERSLASHGEIPEPLIGEMLRAVCNSHAWAQEVMRVVDWFSVLLTRRWRFEGAQRERLREFIKNYDDGIIDYLDLTPQSFGNQRQVKAGSCEGGTHFFGRQAERYPAFKRTEDLTPLGGPRN